MNVDTYAICIKDGEWMSMNEECYGILWLLSC